MTETPTPESIIKATAKHFNIPESLLSDHTNRTNNVAFARHMAMYISRQLTFRSYEQIGKAFGYTPAAVVYGCKQIEKIKNTGKVKQDISAVVKGLK